MHYREGEVKSLGGVFHPRRTWGHARKIGKSRIEDLPTDPFPAAGRAAPAFLDACGVHRLPCTDDRRLVDCAQTPAVGCHSRPHAVYPAAGLLHLGSLLLCGLILCLAYTDSHPCLSTETSDIIFNSRNAKAFRLF